MGLINITPEVDGDLFLLESFPRLHRGDLHSSSSTPGLLWAIKNEPEHAGRWGVGQGQDWLLPAPGNILIAISLS